MKGNYAEVFVKMHLLSSHFIYVVPLSGFLKALNVIQFVK